MATTAIKTRIQLKNDTEAHWLLATNFVPLQGEVIIYSADDTHPFSRLKVGDGTTTVNNLPFIGSHNINNIILEETYNDLPSIGNSHMLYVVIDTLTVYQWSQGNFIKLYGFQKQQITSVSNWDAGTMTELSVSDNGILIVNNGTTPTLSTSNLNVITDFS